NGRGASAVRRRVRPWGDSPRRHSTSAGRDQPLWNRKQSPMRNAPLRVTPGGIAATILVLIVAAVCVRLGFWQLDRLEWRTERNRAVAERLAQPTVPITSARLDTTGLTYRRVELRGEFDETRSFVLAGRTFQG